jgi:glycosyltransferase
MKISIITPTYNSEKTIEQNAMSVIKQNYRNFEQIVIDNLSDDDTLKKIEQLYKNAGTVDKLKILSENDNGITEAFNKGVKAVNGEVIGILNGDDQYYDDLVLEKVANCFKDKNVLFVHGNIYFEDQVYGSNIRKPLLCSVTKAMPYNHPTMFFRKEVFKQYGFFDTGYKLAMDFEFICRLSKSITNFNSRGFYLDDKPLVIMSAGGASWKNELETIKESKKALMKYGYWNYDARKHYVLRRLRTKIKTWLSVIKMESIVTLWRKRKWKNSQLTIK